MDSFSSGGCIRNDMQNLVIVISLCTKIGWFEIESWMILNDQIVSYSVLLSNRNIFSMLKVAYAGSSNEIIQIIKILPQSLFVCLTERCVKGWSGVIYIETGLMLIALLVNTCQPFFFFFKDMSVYSKHAIKVICK